MEYTQLYCTDCTHIPWNKQNIAPLVYVSPGMHSFFLSLFFGISTGIWDRNPGILGDLKEVM